MFNVHRQPVECPRYRDVMTSGRYDPVYPLGTTARVAGPKEKFMKIDWPRYASRPTGRKGRVWSTRISNQRGHLCALNSVLQIDVGRKLRRGVRLTKSNQIYAALSRSMIALLHRKTVTTYTKCYMGFCTPRHTIMDSKKTNQIYL